MCCNQVDDLGEELREVLAPIGRAYSKMTMMTVVVVIATMVAVMMLVAALIVIAIVQVEHRQDSGGIACCNNCGYQWQPKRKTEESRQWSRCDSRKWKGNDAA